MARPQDILALARDYFSGGSHLDEEGEAGLRALLQAAAERAPIVAVTATRDVTTDDEGVILEVDPDGGTVDIQLPAGLPVGYFVQVRQITAGTVRIVANGSTLNVVASAASPAQLSEQWAVASAEVRDTDTWIVTGQLA